MGRVGGVDGCACRRLSEAWEPLKIPGLRPMGGCAGRQRPGETVVAPGGMPGCHTEEYGRCYMPCVTGGSRLGGGKAWGITV